MVSVVGENENENCVDVSVATLHPVISKHTHTRTQSLRVPSSFSFSSLSTSWVRSFN